LIEVRPFGDAAIEIVLDPGTDSTLDDRAAAARTARACAVIRAHAAQLGVHETWGAYGVALATLRASGDHAGETRDACDARKQAIDAIRALLAATPLDRDEDAAPREHVVPAIYDGPDLASVAQACGLSIDALVAQHAAARYEVEVLGFLPGFGYLGGLDPALVVPRRAVPRPRVPAGAIAIAGRKSAIYPLASPGGWNLLGRTEAGPWFDATQEPPARLQPGDVVRFDPIAIAPSPAVDAPAEEREPPPAPLRRPTPHVTASARALIVEAIGPLATVQDRGRDGHRAAAVPASGPLDREAFFAALTAVSGRMDDAAIELPRLGASFRARGELWCSIDGAPPVRLRDGERLSVPRASEAGRAVRYLAVRGGLEVPAVLGARATLLVAGVGGLGGRMLVANDELPTRDSGAEPYPAFAGHEPPDAGTDEVVELALHPSPDAPSRALDACRAAQLRVDPRSDRVGIRLSDAEIPGGAALARSRPLMPGAVQLPPDGQPIVIGPDGPTVGGYPILGILTARALSRLGRTPPGARVRFGLLL
jgi:KipI family sensor histidine kinase inhibitor